MQETERQSFDELIRLYYDYVSGFLRKTTLDETLSEDLTQETFLKMIRSIGTFDPGGMPALKARRCRMARPPHSRPPALIFAALL